MTDVLGTLGVIAAGYLLYPVIGKLIKLAEMYIHALVACLSVLGDVPSTFADGFAREDARSRRERLRMRTKSPYAREI